MIFDFPTIRHKTVEVARSQGYVLQRTLVTRRPWLRIIWQPNQKTIMLGRYRITFSAETDAAEHMAAVEAAAAAMRGDSEQEHTGSTAAESGSMVP